MGILFASSCARLRAGLEQRRLRRSCQEYQGRLMRKRTLASARAATRRYEAFVEVGSDRIRDT